MNHSPEIGTNRRFFRLAFLTFLLTAGLIVFGAIVRVTDSGLGCGNEWPLCDGRVVPPPDNITAWIEWSHRLFAVLIGLLGLSMLTMAVRSYRRGGQLVLAATVTGAVLFAVQSALGAMVVVMDLPPVMVTLHLGTAMLLLAALLIAAIGVRYKSITQTYARDQVTLLVYLTAALSLVIILTGALVRGSGASLACSDWPLCNGSVVPFDQGELQSVHMIHRYAVIGLGISLVLLVWYVLRARRDRLLRGLALGSLLSYLVQAGAGAVFVVTDAAPLWGVTHVGLAALTWALLITLSTIDTLNSRTLPQPVNEDQEDPVWNPQSGTATH